MVTKTPITQNKPAERSEQAQVGSATDATGAEGVGPKHTANMHVST